MLPVARSGRAWSPAHRRNAWLALWLARRRRARIVTEPELVPLAPDQIDDLLAWYDGDVVVESGGVIAEWPSVTNLGVGPSLFPDDANPGDGIPPWPSDEVFSGTLHGAVAFDGYQLAAATGTQLPDEASFLVVARVDEAGSWYGDYGLRYLALNNVAHGTYGWNSPDTWLAATVSLPKYEFVESRLFQSVRNSAAAVSVDWPDEANHLPGDLHLIFGRKRGGTVDLDLYYFDTGEWFRASGPTTAAGFDFDKLCVGGGTVAGTFFTGMIYQLAFWNRALTAEEEDAVAAYLAGIYG